MSSSRTSISNLLPPDLKLLSHTQIASLWSDYGRVYRLTLENRSSKHPKTLILKAIHPPLEDDPSESHLRKLTSYKVERWFYYHLAPRLCSSGAKVAKASLTRRQVESDDVDDDDGNLLLEDLSTEFPIPAYGSLNREGTLCVLDWLATFHGAFFNIHGRESINLVPPPNQRKKHDAMVKGVWQRGTYYYLETRREELSFMDEDEYRWLLPWVEKVNRAIDQECTSYGTLLHGDVKGANIVFNRCPYALSHKRKSDTPKDDPPLTAALYDFQYVGIGLPTLDLVYFIGTSIQPSLLSPSSEIDLLRHYHSALTDTMHSHSELNKMYETAYPFDAFLRHWDLAILDWYRFMAGWGFWGNDRWVGRRAKEILKKWEVDPATAPA